MLCQATCRSVARMTPQAEQLFFFFCASGMSVTVIVDVRYALKPLWYLPAPLDNLERFLFFFRICFHVLQVYHVEDASGCARCAVRMYRAKSRPRGVWQDYLDEIIFAFIKVYWPSRIHLDLQPFKPALSHRHSTWPRPRVCRCQNCSGSMWYSNSTLHLLWQWRKNCRALAAPT